ncbi:outer membrane lipoprotein-sorting protein [Paenibacillus rigui]|uniref:Uncharacterized protein n=1 Tax=Paenibacillus rigui TaxID=554312 RepID=A0A229UYS5_9BACL|nr:outer membrane lipoprotein-sorting protein [Paenibacillus rigui]OXM88401.1 hypothetical protein CF651_00665 [Paenibacillus rigui]
MRRFTWVIALVMCLSLVLAGCGKKDAGSVVKDLDGVINKLQSYQGSGKMVLHTGQEPQEYQVEVWYQNPHYYRISLTNAKKDITQIVLRNDDGVFVLTPHLNKSFRFQSDWPENQGQVYLYQSLVQSILMDNDRQFTTDPNAYVFDVLANYQNGSLARQKIWLDKKSYAPQKVEVSDQNANVMVIVDFNQFEFGKKFEKDSFDMQRNMTSWKLESLPTMGPAGPVGMDNPAGDKAAAGDGKASGTGTHDPGTMDGKSSAAAGTSAKAANGANGSAGAAAAGTTGGANGSSAAKDNAAPSGSSAAANGANAAAGGSKAAAGTGGAATAPSGAATAPSGAAGSAAGATSAAGTAGKDAAAASSGKAAGTPVAGSTAPVAQGASGAASGSAPAGVTSATGSGKTDAGKQKAGQLQFGIIEPNYTPSGVKKQDMNEIKLGEEKAVMLRYTGKFSYTLVESRPETQTVSNLPSDIVDLGYTIAVISGDEKKTLMWTYEGIEFRLSTGDLPLTEMIKVAQAVQGESGK